MFARIAIIVSNRSCNPEFEFLVQGNASPVAYTRIGYNSLEIVPSRICYLPRLYY